MLLTLFQEIRHQNRRPNAAGGGHTRDWSQFGWQAAFEQRGTSSSRLSNSRTNTRLVKLGSAAALDWFSGCWPSFGLTHSAYFQWILGANVWVMRSALIYLKTARIKLIQSTSKTLRIWRCSRFSWISFWSKKSKFLKNQKMFSFGVQSICPNSEHNQISLPNPLATWVGSTGGALCRWFRKSVRNKTRLLELQSVWQLHSPKPSTTPFKLQLTITHFAC